MVDKITPEVAKPAPQRRKAPARKSATGGAKRAVAKSPAAAAPAAAPAATPAPVATPVVETAIATPAPVDPETADSKTPEAPAAAPQRAIAAAPKKDTRIMTTTEYTEKFQTAIKDASEKAKAALEKGQSQLGEMGEFAKGNVEAVVESTKILAAGLQEMGKDYIAEGKTAFEALTAELKDLAAVKTPAEFVEKHTALVRKQFDAAVASSSKTSEAVLKLANEAFQPISTRVSLAVEKIKHAA